VNMFVVIRSVSGWLVLLVLLTRQTLVGTAYRPLTRRLSAVTRCVGRQVPV